MKIIKKIENYKKGLMTAGLSLSILLASNMTVFADAQTGLTTAKTNVINQIKPIVNDVAVPIIDTLLVALLVFAIVRAILAYRKSHDIELGMIIGVVIAIVLVSTFSVWGWQLIS